MVRRTTHALARPGWTPVSNMAAEDTGSVLSQRRWRIMLSALPFDSALDPLPAWVRTPDQFVGWLSCRIDQPGLRGYFLEIQTIAKQTCDLELLRFAKKYIGDC